uniref:Uncharacterized protein n=1 Tax=Rhizophora mucronata TaxID=61149 RepID=A0A2P2PLI5_RHIMU
MTIMVTNVKGLGGISMAVMLNLGNA